MHGGVGKDNLKEENVEAVKAGIVNLERHVNNIRKFGVEPVVALNAFVHDTEDETEAVKAWAKENNVRIALTEVWEKAVKVALILLIKFLKSSINHKNLNSCMI